MHFRIRGLAAEQFTPLTVLGRPLVEGEWDLVRAFVRRMDPDDLRLHFGRFLNFRDEFNLRRFFDVKAGVGEIAWVQDDTGAIAGISHRIMLSQSEAEIAVIVRSDLKRRGIGEFLVRKMLARSARQGLKTLRAVALWENRPVLRLAAKIGDVRREAHADTVVVTFGIDRPAAVA
jgi:acetyltransferase